MFERWTSRHGARADGRCQQHAETVAVGVHPAHRACGSGVTEGSRAEQSAPASRRAAMVQAPAKSPRVGASFQFRNLWLKDKLIGRHGLNGGGRNDAFLTERSAVEHQLTDDCQVFRGSKHASPRRTELLPVQAVPAKVAACLVFGRLNSNQPLSIKAL